MYLLRGGTISAAEFVPAIGRYNFRSRIGSYFRVERKLYLLCFSLSQVHIALRELFLPIAGTTSTSPYRIAAKFEPAIKRNKLADEFEHAIGKKKN